MKGFPGGTAGGISEGIKFCPVKTLISQAGAENPDLGRGRYPKTVSNTVNAEELLFLVNILYGI